MSRRAFILSSSFDSALIILPSFYFKNYIFISESLFFRWCVVGNDAVHGIFLQALYKLRRQVYFVHLRILRQVCLFMEKVRSVPGPVILTLSVFFHESYERIHGSAHPAVVKSADIEIEILKCFKAASLQAVPWNC